jgi:hypothetical protein
VRHCPVQRVKVAATTCTLEAGNALNLTLDLQVSNVTPVIRTTGSRIIAHGTGLQNYRATKLIIVRFTLMPLRPS